MTLALYSKPHEDYALANNVGLELFNHRPFMVTFEGVIGGAISKQLFIGNDSTSHYYSSIQVYPISRGTNNYADGTKEGWEWKLIEKNTEPTKIEWEGVEAGNTLSIASDIGTSTRGDASVFLPFWIRVEVPAKQLATNIVTMRLRLVATETRIYG